MAKTFAYGVIASLILISVGFVSCSDSDPKMWPQEHVKPPKDQNETTDKGTMVAEKPQVDILFVIDDSGSMSSHQQDLSNNIGGFVSQFFTGSVLDYHIGVITSSTDIQYDPGPGWPYPWGNGKLMGNPTYVDRNTVNGLQVLQQKMIVGTNGSGYERFFSPVKMALTEPNLSGRNLGFYRSDAYLAIVYITDADEQSTELPTGDFINFLKGLKPGHPEKILNYAVLVPVNDSTGCPRDPAGEPFKFEDFLQKMKGQEFGLCDADFGQKLAAMGKDLAQKVGKYLLLARKPIEDTIKVKYGSQVIARDAIYGWMYDPGRVAISFGEKIVWSVQPKGTQVEVEFKPANVLPEDQGGH